MPQLTFLGTGNYLAVGRYWNSFVVDGHILVEPSPAVLPNMRRTGVEAAGIDTVLISHFHADHFFGWPFLALELLRTHGPEPIHVIAPPGCAEQLGRTMEAGGVAGLWKAALDQLDLRFVDAGGPWHDAPSARVRGVRVDHVPYLECFGYLIEAGGTTIGYSGDVIPCDGLDELAEYCDVLVLECNGPHPPPAAHMDVSDVEALRARFARPRFLLTHVGPDIHAEHIDRCSVPDDFDVIDV